MRNSSLQQRSKRWQRSKAIAEKDTAEAKKETAAVKEGEEENIKLKGASMCANFRTASAIAEGFSPSGNDKEYLNALNGAMAMLQTLVTESKCPTPTVVVACPPPEKVIGDFDGLKQSLLSATNRQTDKLEALCAKTSAEA